MTKPNLRTRSQLGIPIGIAISPDGKYAYLSNLKNVAVVRISDNKVLQTFPVRNWGKVVISPEGEYLYNSYFAEEFGGGVTVIKTSNNTFVDGLIIPGGAGEIICAPSGKDIYVASPATDKVFVIKSVTSPRQESTSAIY